jgi:hypothetical protein
LSRLTYARDQEKEVEKKKKVKKKITTACN